MRAGGKWDSTVGGVLELYRNDRQGIPKLEQRETIFPAPTIPPPQAPPSTQLVNIRRGELFGNALLPGRNPNDILPLDISRLRANGQTNLAKMGLIPNCDENNQVPGAAVNGELLIVAENFKTLKPYDIPAGDSKRRQMDRWMLGFDKADQLSLKEPGELVHETASHKIHGLTDKGS